MSKGPVVIEVTRGPMVESRHEGIAAVVKPDGKRRILLVNKRDRPFDISIAGAIGGQEEHVDQITAFDPPSSAKLTGDTVRLNGLSVTVVTLP